MPTHRYTKPQIRARVAALEIAADHLDDIDAADPTARDQYADVAVKLRAEANRLKNRHDNRRDRLQLTPEETELTHILETQIRWIDAQPDSQKARE